MAIRFSLACFLSIFSIRHVSTFSVFASGLTNHERRWVLYRYIQLPAAGSVSQLIMANGSSSAACRSSSLLALLTYPGTSSYAEPSFPDWQVNTVGGLCVSHVGFDTYLPTYLISTSYHPLHSACYGYSICLPGVLSESVACVQQLSSFPAFLLAWVGLVYLCTARYR